MVRASGSLRRRARAWPRDSVKGVMASPVYLTISARVPTAVERWRSSVELASLRMGFSKIFHSSPKAWPRAAARPTTTSRAVSTTSQSYSEEPASTSCSSSSSPRSCWQGCERVMMRLTVETISWRAPSLAESRAGPQALRVAATFLLMSVTTELQPDDRLANAFLTSV